MPRRADDTPEPLIPYAQTLVSLPGWDDDIPVACDEDGHVYWPIRALCLWLGVDSAGQIRRLRQHRKLSKHLHYYTLRTSRRGNQHAWTIEQRWVGYWFGMLDDPRVRDEITDRLEAFQDDLAAYANMQLFGQEQVFSIDQLSEAEVRQLLKQLVMDNGRLKLVYLQLEKRLGKVEGMLSFPREDDRDV